MNQKGVVLLTTLLMIALLGLWVLINLNTVFLYSKQVNQLISSHDEVYFLEAAARQIALSINSNTPPPCQVKEDNPNKLLALLQQSQGCKIDSAAAKYHYIISRAGSFPCLLIYKNNQEYSSEHWWITLQNEKKRFLQVRVAVATAKKECPLPLSHRINEGFLSWRSG